MRRKGNLVSLLYMQYVVFYSNYIHGSDLLNSECGGTFVNVDKGEITQPITFQDPLLCTWILSAPPGSKIVVNINQVYLPFETDVLYVEMDGQGVNLSRKCDKCWSNLVGETLNVTYEFDSSRLANFTFDEEDESDENDENNFNDTQVNYTNPISFQVTYQSFHPSMCDFPKQPSNGYIIDKNRTVGSVIKFRCDELYEVSGPVKSTCVKIKDSPIPRWNPPAYPKCLIPECNGKIQTKEIQNTGYGLIVHPGYPAKMVLSGQHCIWHLKTLSSRRRVHLNVKFFSLPSGKSKKKTGSMSSYLDVFDNSTENLMVKLQGQLNSRNITSSSNLLILELTTANISLKGNDAGGGFGFNIEYGATCDVIDNPFEGSKVGDDFIVGSKIRFNCNAGYELLGDSVVTCLPDHTWSSPAPKCVPRSNATKKLDPSIHQDIKSKENEKYIPKNDDDFVATPKPTKPFPPSGSIPILEDSVDEHESSSSDKTDTTTLAIALGVFLPLAVLLIVVLAILWYRRQHPVRIGFGRRFDTFENPAYERKKKKSSDDPAELQKLTSLPSP